MKPGLAPREVEVEEVTAEAEVVAADSAGAAAAEVATNIWYSVI
jgi:hypothetical protein